MEENMDREKFIKMMAEANCMSYTDCSILRPLSRKQG